MRVLFLASGTYLSIWLIGVLGGGYLPAPGAYRKRERKIGERISRENERNRRARGKEREAGFGGSKRERERVFGEGNPGSGTIPSSFRTTILDSGATIIVPVRRLEGWVRAKGEIKNRA